jgi:hypothetical protein
MSLFCVSRYGKKSELVLSDEERKLQERQLKKIRWAEEKKRKENEDRKLQRRIDHAKYILSNRISGEHATLTFE